ncbi:hypothetical protein [Kitasatospora sp. NPDC090308]|uniref:hypothetical protein n=1 Tax=Kitasatospora sp. NPDC090308 TaxID=3364082 RepID=UPI003816D7F3
MTTLEAETGQRLSAAREPGAALVAAHRLLGRELGALAAEESRTGSSSRDRTATLRRKKLLQRDILGFVGVRSSGFTIAAAPGALSHPTWLDEELQ